MCMTCIWRVVPASRRGGEAMPSFPSSCSRALYVYRHFTPIDNLARARVGGVLLLWRPDPSPPPRQPHGSGTRPDPGGSIPSGQPRSVPILFLGECHFLDKSPCLAWDYSSQPFGLCAMSHCRPSLRIAHSNPGVDTPGRSQRTSTTLG
jgi:hypothetical protein